MIGEASIEMAVLPRPPREGGKTTDKEKAKC
jgi:hypothetical protein